jgi:GntR family transcriptional regulator
VEPSAVSLGPTALAARDALRAEIAASAPGRTRGRAGGIFVAERKVERDLTSLAGLPAYLRRQGFQADARVLATATIAADAETAAALALAPGALVLEVVRVRLADGEPISLERARFPAERFPDLLDRSLSGSLYELFDSQYGLAPGEAEERIEVVAAGTAEAQLLGIRRGAPLLAIARTAWDAEGRPFERSQDLFRADRARIVVRARSAPAAPTLVGASVQVV